MIELVKLSYTVALPVAVCSACASEVPVYAPSGTETEVMLPAQSEKYKLAPASVVKKLSAKLILSTRILAFDKCTVSRKFTSNALSVPVDLSLLSTNSTVVISIYVLFIFMRMLIDIARATTFARDRTLCFHNGLLNLRLMVL